MAPGFDFKRKAEEVLVKEGFRPHFPPDVLAASASLSALPDPRTEDLRHLLWSSIDNTESRDLDQVEWAEKLTSGEIRILVGIADVACLARENSPIDQHAAFNGTSVYTGGPIFPMLPDRLSTDLTSLRENADRAAVVIEFKVGLRGEVGCGKVYRALIRNHARLVYNRVGPWLRGESPSFAEPGFPAELPAQLRLQHEASHRLMDFRREQGALAFGGSDRVPIFVNNQVHFDTIEHNAARDIIESFMIAANVTMAGFLRCQGSVCIRRIVREPKRWDRIQAIAAQYGVQLPNEPDSRALSHFMADRKNADPVHFPEVSLAILKSLGPGEYAVEHPGMEREGHFGLAVHDYSHSTAPNRRYADLLMQRLIKAALDGAPLPLSESELARLALHCTQREAAARDVERFMKKVAAAMMLCSQIGHSYDGIITGVTPKGTFVRLLPVPAEGRIMRGERGLDVGEKVRVRLIGVDVERGFIDFEPVL